MRFEPLIPRVRLRRLYLLERTSRSHKDLIGPVGREHNVSIVVSVLHSGYTADLNINERDIINRLKRVDQAFPSILHPRQHQSKMYKVYSHLEHTCSSQLSLAYPLISRLG
jgi:hypothetical protein